MADERDFKTTNPKIESLKSERANINKAINSFVKVEGLKAETKADFKAVTINRLNEIDYELSELEG